MASHALALVAPVVEIGVGALVLVGLFTRWALAVGAITMVLLLVATSVRGELGALGVQMLYVVVYYLLLADMRSNTWALDAVVASVTREEAGPPSRAAAPASKAAPAPRGGSGSSPGR